MIGRNHAHIGPLVDARSAANFAIIVVASFCNAHQLRANTVVCHWRSVGNDTHTERRVGVGSYLTATDLCELCQVVFFINTARKQQHHVGQRGRLDIFQCSLVDNDFSLAAFPCHYLKLRQGETVALQPKRQADVFHGHELMLQFDVAQTLHLDGMLANRYITEFKVAVDVRQGAQFLVPDTDDGEACCLAIVVGYNLSLHRARLSYGRNHHAKQGKCKK